MQNPRNPIFTVAEFYKRSTNSSRWTYTNATDIPICAGIHNTNWSSTNAAPAEPHLP